MIRRVIRWGFYLLIFALVLIVAGVLCVDSLVKSVAESRIRAQTGLNVKIGRFVIGLSSPVITIEDFRLYNPPEFGGGVFVHMREMHLEYDREAMRSGHLHLHLVRINLAEVNIVERADGKTNFDDLKRRQTAAGGVASEGPARPPRPPAGRRFVFDGIDTLNLTLGRLRYTSLRQPAQNSEKDLGIRQILFKNVNTEKDMETVAATIALKSGANFALESFLGPSPGESGAVAGRQMTAIMDSAVAPLRVVPRMTNQFGK